MSSIVILKFSSSFTDSKLLTLGKISLLFIDLKS